MMNSNHGGGDEGEPNHGDQTPRINNTPSSSNRGHESQQSTTPMSSTTPNTSGMVQNAYRSYLRLIRDGGYSPYLNNPPSTHHKKEDVEALASPADTLPGHNDNDDGANANEGMLEFSNNEGAVDRGPVESAGTPMTPGAESEVHSLALANRTGEIMSSYEEYLAEINEEGSPILKFPTMFSTKKMDLTPETARKLQQLDVENRYNVLVSGRRDGGFNGINPDKDRFNLNPFLDKRQGYEGQLSSIGVPLRVDHKMDFSYSGDWINLADDLDKLEQVQRYRNPIAKSPKTKRNILGLLLLCLGVAIFGFIITSDGGNDGNATTQSAVSNLEAPHQESKKDLPHQTILKPPKQETRNPIPVEQMDDHEAQDVTTAQPSEVSIENTESSTADESSSNKSESTIKSNERVSVSKGAQESKNPTPAEQIDDHNAQDVTTAQPSQVLIEKTQSSTADESSSNKPDKKSELTNKPNEEVQAPESKPESTIKPNKEVQASESDGAQESTTSENLIGNHKPKWFDRSQGWVGKTYDDATSFCASQDSKLCSFTSICPDGVGKAPLGGFRREAEAWAPIIGVPNGWISVATATAETTSCLDYNSAHTHSPLWGVSGHDLEEDGVDHSPAIMCCPDSLTDTVQGSKSEPNGAQASITDDNNLMAKYKPKWFDRSQGWTGETYDDATSFCASQDSQPCPYEAICPDGVGRAPWGGFRPEAEAWAPIDVPNGWVSIAAATTYVASCLDYNSEHTHPPEWGVTRQDSEQEKVDHTPVVMCCEVPRAGEIVHEGDYDLNDVSQTALPPTNTESSEEITESSTADQSSSNKPENKPESTIKPSGAQEPTTKHQPKWYDRSQGWTGKTYIDSILFCASQDSHPCPHETICPDGPGRAPWGGVRPEEEAWAPIIDVPNGWVSIAPASPEAAPCLDYNSGHKYPPLWGVLGKDSEEDEVDHTPAVMCCQAPFDGKNNDSDQVQGSTYDLDDSSKAVATPTTEEQQVMDELYPVWYGRKDGYHGTTHKEATSFCSTIADMHLCPRVAYCPNGPGSSKPLFLHQDAFEGDQWAPVATEGTEGALDQNKWVLIGSVNDHAGTCMAYDQIHSGEEPEWELDGSRTELKENILCCPSPNNLVKKQDTLKLLDPIWLDESHGWNGGSHNDAMEFCESLDHRMLCPYSAYCPYGRGQPVMGGHTQDFNSFDEQWAPVFGKENNWVMVGKKYDNLATTCMDNFELGDDEPDWGLSGDRAEVKSHIMCCAFHE